MRCMAVKYRNMRYRGSASKKEANRAAELHALAQAGAITDLEQQVKFELVPKDELGRPVHYIADFVYRSDGKLIVEDVKGFPTAVYKLKKRLMWCHKSKRYEC